MMVPVHPGACLAGEMAERGLSAGMLAAAIKVPTNRVSEIVAGRRRLTAETALRLGCYFGTGPELWVNLQAHYDLAIARKEHGAKVLAEVKTAA